jgi:hypothetical protein
MAPSMPPDGMVGLGVLFLQTHASVHQPPTPPNAIEDITFPVIYGAIVALLPQQTLPRRKAHPLHGRLPHPRRLLRGHPPRARLLRDFLETVRVQRKARKVFGHRRK